MILNQFDPISYDDNTIANIISDLYDYYTEIREEFILQEYQIRGSDRPEIVAFKLYNDVELEWVLLLTNNIVDPWDEWVKSDEVVREQAEFKYANVTNTTDGIHHLRDPKTGDIYYNLVEDVTGSGNWYHEGDTGFLYRQFAGTLVPVTNVEHELEVNEERRTIKIIRPSDINRFRIRFQDIINDRNN